VSVRLVFPDTLSWISGTEVGLQAMAEARRLAGIQVNALVERRGNRFEAVRFAVHQLGLSENVCFSYEAVNSIQESDCVVLPRLAPNLEIPVDEHALLASVAVTSEPGVMAEPPRVLCFPRWDSHYLANLFTRWACH
jgi:hypothetical protein